MVQLLNLTDMVEEYRVCPGLRFVCFRADTFQWDPGKIYIGHPRVMLGVKVDGQVWTRYGMNGSLFQKSKAESFKKYTVFLEETAKREIHMRAGPWEEPL